MKNKVISLPNFDRNYKRLKKKYRSLTGEVEKLVEELEINPQKGTLIKDNFYKIRIAISSKGKGKSGGARIITYFIIEKDIVYLLSIYDKSEKENMTDNEIRNILKENNL